jgi:hypothetical protein
MRNQRPGARIRAPFPEWFNARISFPLFEFSRSHPASQLA